MVEFHKDPRDINEAVDHVVYYCEMGRQPKANDERRRHCSRQVEADNSGKSSASSDEDGQAARVGERPRKGESWHPKGQRGGNAGSASGKHTNTPIQQVPTKLKLTRQSRYKSSENKWQSRHRKGASSGHASNAGGR